MKYNKSTYITLSGVKQIIEPQSTKPYQWVVYHGNVPRYFVDVFDLKEESNAIMNSLVLCSQRSINEVLKIINQKNNVNLNIPKISRLGISYKIKFETEELNLTPIPLKWLSYSW